MYQLIVETLLGLQLKVDQLRLSPRLPRAWDALKIHYRHRDTFYHITITQHAADSTDPDQLLLDGMEIPGKTVPLVDDRREHTVEMRVR